MAVVDPLQWIVIGVVVVVIFLWGPQKIPDIAKALGRARKEYEQGSKEPLDAAAPQKAPPELTGDQMLVETARKLGIATEGKTRDQLSQEMVERVKARQQG